MIFTKDNTMDSIIEYAYIIVTKFFIFKMRNFSTQGIDNFIAHVLGELKISYYTLLKYLVKY